MYKEKLQQKLNTDKGPKTNIKDKDYKRVYVEDRPSSDEENEKPAIPVPARNITGAEEGREAGDEGAPEHQITEQKRSKS